jgi:uncharacterized protein YdiU (UPF0061 family)
VKRPLPGAVLTRVAASHLRVGTFQYFAARGELDKLGQLTAYAIARHDPELAAAPDRPLALLRAVAQRQAALIAQWMNVGFIHGVMNTDNMTISGETIDYGPCAFMEGLRPGHGLQQHRPRWALRLRQPAGHRALEPRAAGRDAAAADGRRRRRGRRAAGGGAGHRGDRRLPRVVRRRAAARPARQARPVAEGADDAADRSLVDDWLALLEQHEVDFTLAWRRLADAAEGATPTRCVRCSAKLRRSTPGWRAGRPAAASKTPATRAPVLSARRGCAAPALA